MGTLKHFILLVIFYPLNSIVKKMITKKSVLTSFLLLLAILACGQLKGKKGIQMISKYSSDNPEIDDILKFERIDYYKIEFVGSQLIGKNYSLVVKEIWNGEIKKTDTLINTANNDRIGELSTDTLSLKVIAKKSVDNKLKMSFGFPTFTINRKFDATNSDEYSLRDIGRQLTIEPNKEFYALAYILPYEKDGWKLWLCR